MKHRASNTNFTLAAAVVATAAVAGQGAMASPAPASALVLDPARAAKIGETDPRYQSYNVEMVEIVGGRFWAPYPSADDASDGKPALTAEQARAAMFRQREPLNLADPRLRTIAGGLGPVYVRVSGAWANSVYFHDSDASAPATAPKGFEGVLTRPQWAGVVAFAKAINARLVVSFPVSAGARNPDGSWNPDQARRLIRYTLRLGGRIYAAELINEPNVGTAVGLPRGYRAADFARDIAAFRALVSVEAPDIKVVGPGSTGEAGFMMFRRNSDMISTDALMTAKPTPRFDIFSYHSYGTVSQRCARMDPSAGTSPEAALGDAWLARADTIFDHYKAVQARFVPGKPIWITETAQTGCGGDRWAATWLDTFRYVDQLGRLAQRGAAVSFHNTLSASDYALVDDVTLAPRPSYWAAVLWRHTMGARVLGGAVSEGPVHGYLQCLPDRAGGVGAVVLNLDQTASRTVRLPTAAQRFTLTADRIDASSVSLNGTPLAMTSDGRLPAMRGAAAAAGNASLPPASITFLRFDGVKNPSCR